LPQCDGNLCTGIWPGMDKNAGNIHFIPLL
jgi:hypothetical protein